MVEFEFDELAISGEFRDILKRWNVEMSQILMDFHMFGKTEEWMKKRLEINFMFA